MANNVFQHPTAVESQNPFTNACFVTNFCRIPNDQSGDELRQLFLQYATDYARAHAFDARCKRHAAERNMRMLDALERRGMDGGGGGSGGYADVQPVTQRWFSAAPAYNPQDVYPVEDDDAWSATFEDNNVEEEHRPVLNVDSHASEVVQPSDSDFDSESTIT